MKLFSNSRGQAVIELALIFPFLFIFLFAVSEFSYLFVQDQRVTALSREASGAAFRECSGLPIDEMDSCLQNIANELSVRGAALLPGFDSRGLVIVSMYQSGSTGAVEQAGLKVSGGGSGDTTYSTGSFDSGFVADNGFIAVGEAFYDYQPLTPIESLLTLLQLPDNLYEATVF